MIRLTSATPRPATPVAADQNLISWSFDPVHAVSSTSPSAGALSLVRIPIRAITTITNILVGVGTAGSALTAGQNLAGLYLSDGDMVATTADQTTAWGSSGVKTMALTSPYTPPAGTNWLWVGLLSNAGTSTPAFARAGALAVSDLSSAGLTASTRRFGTFGTGQTALPDPITPASIGAVANGTFWAGLS